MQINYSGVASGRVLTIELYTCVYRNQKLIIRVDISSINSALILKHWDISIWNRSVNKCRKNNF